MRPVYVRNGLPPAPDVRDADDGFTAVSFLAIPYAPM